MGLGLYIHIPFCRSKCVYCDFYSLAGREERMDEYQRALAAHLETAAPAAEPFKADTVYFGGGTPSYFGADRLARLLERISKCYRLSGDAEITLEANPDSTDPAGLKMLRESGFNRLSLGMQSADDCQLAGLGRPHTEEQTERAVSAAREAGFENISLDIIYGLPGQDRDGWQATLEKAVSLGPQHISAYGLTVEENTPLARRVAEGEILPDDDAQADLYLQAVRFLEREGYGQYEISNFARPGFESRHNLKYWTLEPYLGFGPGAHSDFGGRRFSWARDLDGYIYGALNGNPPAGENAAVSQAERAGEYLMLGLRTADGISGDRYEKKYGGDFAPVQEKMTEFQERGWARMRDGNWRLTPEGFQLSNQLIGQVLDAAGTEIFPPAPDGGENGQ